MQIRGAADLSLQTAASNKACKIPSTPEKVFRGGPYRDLGTQTANNIGVQRHHILAKKVILDNPDVAAKFGIDQWNPPALTLIPADHIKTKSWGSFSYFNPYRKEQERLLRAGNINEIFQIEYDFLTSPQFEGRYDQAIQEAIDYAFDQGMITKKPIPRAAGLEANVKDTQNGFCV
ncbi:hypothetical protein [Corynebacterium pilosum]|uniref:hypothetical protein n=1 Tax=Corynebacterium pilosum TaxID=35756 RepID=UPI0015598B10|nr:hypothetical protein [Corynebacterium pilosum]